MTKILEYPNPTAAAMAKPSAADFPRPRAAVRETVLLNTPEVNILNLSKYAGSKHIKSVKIR